MAHSSSRVVSGAMFDTRLDSYIHAGRKEGRKEMFYLTMHLTHLIYGSLASDIW